MSKAIETLDINGRRVLDVSGLPTSGTGPREPVWWGNALLMCIETTTVVLLLVSYYYLRRNFDVWPPPQSNSIPPLFRPVPDLAIPTTELLLLIISWLPMYWTAKAAKREEGSKVKLGLAVMLALNALLVVLRFMELRTSHLKFAWNDNAYGSIIWTIVGLHLTYLLGSVAEFFIMFLWIVRHGLDFKHGLDVTLAADYWYWIIGTWIACYLTVYWGARLL